MGLYSQVAQRELGHVAISIYDQTALSISYLRSAQNTMTKAEAGWWRGKTQVDAGLQTAIRLALPDMLGDLEVARERAMSSQGASAVDRVRAALDQLSKPAEPEDAGRELERVEKADVAFATAVEIFAADGFRYRQNVGDMVALSARRTWYVVGFSVVVGVLITALLSRSIMPAVMEALRVAEAIAGGTLNNAIQLRGRGEAGDLLRALGTMQGGIAAARARLEAALDNMSQGLCLFDADGRLAMANRRFNEMFGPSAVGVDYSQIMKRSGLDLAASDAAAPLSLSRETPDGRAIAVSQRQVSSGGWVTTFDDVSERRDAEARVAHMARHDVLTGLANRLMFNEHMANALARARRGQGLAVHCLDLDRFKTVNDSMGHAAGDALLRMVARRLLNCTRDTDLVVRLGGDEFVIVQEEATGPLDAGLLAERVIQSLTASFEIDGQHVNVGASIGIALTQDGLTAADALLKCADLALYRSKSSRRGVYCFFEDEMDVQMQARQELERDLRKAFIEGQFVLHYQPLMEAGSGGVTGFEALLRWNHPVRGVISPAVFIPVAEDIGLIGGIGNWVLLQACSDAAAWPGQLKVAVNLSPAQFRDRNLTEDAANALLRSRLPAGRLELEITESVLMQDDDLVLASLHALRALGVRIAMDDFGTGYSSLSYLRRFPFDKIKIDQSFIRGMETQDDCQAIIRAIIGLGRSLGMTVNAEGVETTEQSDQLRSEGCEELQGYLFSRPMPVTEIAAMLHRLGNATLVRDCISEVHQDARQDRTEMFVAA